MNCDTYSVKIPLYSKNQSCMLLSGVNSELGLNITCEVDSFMSQYWLRFFSGLIFFYIFSPHPHCNYSDYESSLACSPLTDCRTLIYMNTGAQPPFMTGEDGDCDSVSDWFRALYGPEVCLVEAGILSVL